MRTIYRRVLAEDAKEGDFWPSFTDLLATMLLVILLVLLAVIVTMQDDWANANEELKESREQLLASEQELANDKEMIEKQQEMIDYLLGIERNIIEDLMVKFDETNLRIEIDPETGAIKFEDNLLFDDNEAVVLPKFKERLQEFVPVYFDILYGHYGDHIAEIVVEGHTDDRGTYIYNLGLSQERAFNIVRYMLSDEFGDFPYKEEVRSQITANGRSFSQLRYVEGTNTVDRDNSRRVEFKFRLKNYTEMEGMLKELGF